MTKYKYITIWTSYDKVEQKMTELSQEGYEYDNCYFVIVRMKKTNTKPKKYKFIYDKNFSPEVTEYYKAAGWRLHKVKLTYFLRLAEGDENSYPIFSDEETEYEIIKYRVLRFFYTMLLGCLLYTSSNAINSGIKVKSNFRNGGRNGTAKLKKDRSSAITASSPLKISE